MSKLRVKGSSTGRDRQWLWSALVSSPGPPIDNWRTQQSAHCQLSSNQLNGRHSAHSSGSSGSYRFIRSAVRLSPDSGHQRWTAKHKQVTAAASISKGGQHFTIARSTNQGQAYTETTQNSAQLQNSSTLVPHKNLFDLSMTCRPSAHPSSLHTHTSSAAFGAHSSHRHVQPKIDHDHYLLLFMPTPSSLRLCQQLVLDTCSQLDIVQLILDLYFDRFVVIGYFKIYHVTFDTLWL